MTYTTRYDPDTDFDRHYTIGTGRAIARWVRPGDRVLELGCATGLMTEAFAAAGAHVCAVDQSQPYLDRLGARELPNVEAHRLDLADGFPPGSGFDHVVATNLLHQIGDPAGFLAACAERLAPHGALHLSIPNPRSLHRLVAFEMGLIDDLKTLSALGLRNEVLRVMDDEEVVALGRTAGLDVAHREGVMVKPLPNDQMAALPDAVIEGFQRAARHVPELCAMSYFLLRRAG